jgi:hypothetical protein
MQADCSCTGSPCLYAVQSAAPSPVPLPTPGEAPNSCPASSLSSPTPVDLVSACSYAILAKSGISTVPTSAITGDSAVSPIDSGSITGFTLALDSSGHSSTSSQLTSKAFADNYSSPTPGDLNVAFLDLKAAYTEASQRTATSSMVDGAIGGLSLTTGVYTFTSGINITSVFMHRYGCHIHTVRRSHSSTRNLIVMFRKIWAYVNVFLTITSSLYLIPTDSTHVT